MKEKREVIFYRLVFWLLAMGNGSGQTGSKLRPSSMTAKLSYVVGPQQLLPWSQRYDHLSKAFMLTQIFAWIPVCTESPCVKPSNRKTKKNIRKAACLGL